jgi:hypothetical protein
MMKCITSSAHCSTNWKKALMQRNLKYEILDLGSICNGIRRYSDSQTQEANHSGHNWLYVSAKPEFTHPLLPGCSL